MDFHVLLPSLRIWLAILLPVSNFSSNSDQIHWIGSEFWEHSQFILEFFISRDVSFVAQAPVVISRDHHDVSGTDSPFRETSNVYDGSAFCAGTCSAFVHYKLQQTAYVIPSIGFYLMLIWRCLRDSLKLLASLQFTCWNLNWIRFISQESEKYLKKKRN